MLMCNFRMDILDRHPGGLGIFGFPFPVADLDAKLDAGKRDALQTLQTTKSLLNSFPLPVEYRYCCDRRQIDFRLIKYARGSAQSTFASGFLEDSGLSSLCSHGEDCTRF